MSAVTKLMTPGGGGVALTPASSIASDVTVNVPSVNGTLVSTGSTAQVSQAMLASGVAGTGPAFSAYQSAGQNLSNNTDTKVTFDTEEFDTANCFSSSRFTPNVAGYYQISGACNTSVNSGGSRFLSLRKNGSAYKVLQVVTPNGTNYMNLSGSTLVYLNGSTDYVEIYMNQNSGSTLTTGGSQSEVWFNGALVRAA